MKPEDLKTALLSIASALETLAQKINASAEAATTNESGPVKPKKGKKADEKTTEEKTTEEKTVKSFSVNNPPENDADRKAFKEHWKALGKRQADYTKGLIDSLGNSLEQTETTAETTTTEETNDFEGFEIPGDEIKAPSLDDVRTLCTKVASAGSQGRDKVIKVMVKYKIKNVNELKKDEVAKFYAELEKCI